MRVREVGLGRYTCEGSLQGSRTIKSSSLDWASLIAQLVKKLPAVQETPVRFLGWEDPLQ